MHMVCSKRRLPGFTLVELIVSIVLVAVVAGLILPSSASRTSPKSRIKCVHNLKNIGLAFQIFAVDHEDRFPMEISTNEGGSLEFVNEGAPFRHFVALSNELSTPTLLVCPTDEKGKPATNFPLMRSEQVSYFVGLDAKIGHPRLVLTGDQNLTINQMALSSGLVDLTTNGLVGWTREMHNRQGNVGLGDGSVQQTSDFRLADLLRRTGKATYRLAVP
jgi:prepilin-type N-terminal cleavage/methylation domain-containing protein